MRIDLNKAQKEFLNYTEKFDLKNENIELKQLHSLRVMKISKEIATRLGLSQNDIDLATLIGLLHDIARFEQYKQFQTFRDLESFDHGDYAIKILEKEIRKYVETTEYDNIIKVAIKNHNKIAIEEGLTEQEMLFAKIIRDADKIDIFYEALCFFWKNEEEKVNISKISDRVYDQFNDKKLIKREKNVKLENVDSIISVIVFIFDINFKVSFEILKEKDYINQIINRFKFKDEETKEKIEKIRKIANEYINMKVEK